MSDSFAANCTQKESLMLTFSYRALSMLASVGVLATLALATAHAGDCESDRILRYYERCYGTRGPYCVSCDRCARNAQAAAMARSAGARDLPTAAIARDHDTAGS